MQLSIRSYSRQINAHSHVHHQLVLPLQGSIRLLQTGFEGLVSPGECVVIHAGNEHQFSADEVARFLVADLQDLPANLMQAQRLVFAITESLQRFCEFVEAQLSAQVNASIEEHLKAMFWLLLSEQQDFRVIDARIRRVQAYIEQHLNEPLTLQQLAQQAHLSSTQLKALFRQHTGETAMDYLTRLRMNKAKALLLHTDLPIQHIAEHCGYLDNSAFSRRFRRYHGVSPSKMRE
ncbi:AraC family transcriptional regulator [Bacterioplanes sanyensis]|uniref:AraC family transcriptional regulator n=1 Tax=Bacterioplanes sanyensis TaxID=1249553 RepID=UPI001678932B|nr:AraC family transcriptional regulator [Bacterioplanes sanyensis]GGY56739.1 AraC family transcriptional regulator [Bacterioplanes sanyensis]